RRHTRSTRDWSSDVCSSDLFRNHVDRVTVTIAIEGEVDERSLRRAAKRRSCVLELPERPSHVLEFAEQNLESGPVRAEPGDLVEIGRATCRDSVHACRSRIK